MKRGAGSSTHGRFLVLIICLYILGYAGSSCNSSGTSDEAGSVESGTLIGSRGGTVAASEQADAISGAKVYIPPNALASEQSITLKSASLPGALPAGYKAAGPCISFNPDGITFAQPVSLYLPYTDANKDGIVDGKAVHDEHVRILYYDSKNARWQELAVQGNDSAKGLVVTQTSHFSTYLAAIDTSDSQTLDSGTTGSTTTGQADDFSTGDCLVGGGNIGTGNSDDCFYYNLTITRRGSGLVAIVDRFATYVTTGIPATISEGGDSATFDAASTFTKVLASGDATKWEWECEFVKEYTFLKDYQVLDDSLAQTASSTGISGITGGIEAVDANMVKISWQINVNEQVLYATTPQGKGHSLVIRFRASYK